MPTREASTANPAAGSSAARQRRGRRGWMWSALAWVSAMIVAFPFLWALRSSVFPGQEAMRVPPEWIPTSLTLSHFADLLHAQPFLRYLINSTIVALAAAIGQVITASTAGYAFAKLRFPGRNKVFLAYLATMMIPAQVTIIPQYLIIADLGWIDSYKALIIPSLATAFSTFLMRQFIIGIPKEYDEAAKIDGAGYFRTFLLIVMPLCRPALSTVALLAFMSSWGNFMWPLVVTSSTNLRTIPLGLASLQSQQGFTDFAQIMAGSVVGVLPMFVMFLFLQRFVISAAATSGLKG